MGVDEAYFGCRGRLFTGPFYRCYLYLLDIYERLLRTSVVRRRRIRFTSQTFSFSNGVLVNPLLACRVFLAPVLPFPSENNSEDDAESHATRIKHRSSCPILAFERDMIECPHEFLSHFTDTLFTYR